MEAIGDKLYGGVPVSFVSLIGLFVGYCILICLSY